MARLSRALGPGCCQSSKSYHPSASRTVRTRSSRTAACGHSCMQTTRHSLRRTAADVVPAHQHCLTLGLMRLLAQHSREALLKGDSARMLHWIWTEALGSCSTRPVRIWAEERPCRRSSGNCAPWSSGQVKRQIIGSKLSSDNARTCWNHHPIACACWSFMGGPTP